MIKKILNHKWIFLASVFSVISCKTKSLENEESAVRATEQAEATFYKKLPIEFIAELNGSDFDIAKYATVDGRRVMLRDANSTLPGYMVKSHDISINGIFGGSCTSTNNMSFSIGSSQYTFPMKKRCDLYGSYEYESKSSVSCRQIFHIATGVDNVAPDQSNCFFMLKSTGGSTGTSIIIYPQDIGIESPLSGDQIRGAIEALKPATSGNVNLGFVAPRATFSEVVQEMKRLHEVSQDGDRRQKAFESCLLNPRSNNWSDIQSYYYCMLSFEFRSQCYSKRLIEGLYSAVNISKLASIADSAQKRIEQLRQSSEAANLAKDCAENPLYQSEFGQSPSERTLGKKVFESLMPGANILTYNIAEQYKIINAVFGGDPAGVKRRATDAYDVAGANDYSQPNQLRHLKVMQAQK